MTQSGRATAIFLRACDLPSAERAAFLADACAGDAGLSAEVEAMLAADARAEAGEGTGALAAPVAGVAARAAAGISAPEPIPGRIGPYQILEVLGEGGMGVVYRAEQTEPIRREVALKLVRMAIDSGGALARFESERQVLAMMDHPHIARLLDAGATAEGRPYFVMELVRGMPITRFCREGKVAVRSRVRLFLDVCRAVRHAHRHGVIHRDLKPSNILISQEGGQPVPKVIDFSIAKALGEPGPGTEFRTRTGQLVGTLEYMSPEQALGRAGAIDTRSDVYALGVVLHELMADRLPHDVEGQPLLEAVRRIAEDPPRSLRGAATTASGRLDADLETIAGKCLEKDPDRRYGSAAELVEDLERYLDSRPIQARPPSTLYQMRKLVGRHRALFGGAALVFALLLVFSIVVTIQLGVQRRERARAEAAASRAERVSAFLQDLIAAASPEKMGRDATVREVLDQAAARLEKGLHEEPMARGDTHHTVGMAYAALGNLEEAVKHLGKALEIHRSVHAGDHESIARDLIALAEHYSMMPEHVESANELWQEGLSMWRRLVPEPHPQIIDALGRLATSGVRLIGHAEAERLASEAVAMAEALPGPDERRLGAALARQGLVFWESTKFSQAEQALRRAVDLLTKTLGAEHLETINHRNDLGTVLSKMPDRGEEAVVILRETLAQARAILGPDHMLVAAYANNLSAWLLEKYRLEEARPLQEEARRIWRHALGETHWNLTIAANNLAFMHQLLGDRSSAAGEYQEMMNQLGRLGLPPEGILALNYAHFLHVSGRDAEAESLLREALAREKAAGLQTPWRPWMLEALGCIALDSGRVVEAERHLMAAQESRQEEKEPCNWFANEILFARLRALEGREAESRALFQKQRDRVSYCAVRISLGALHLLPLIAAHQESRGDFEEAARYREALARMNRIMRGKEPDWWKEPPPGPISDAPAVATQADRPL